MFLSPAKTTFQPLLVPLAANISCCVCVRWRGLCTCPHLLCQGKLTRSIFGPLSSSYQDYNSPCAQELRECTVQKRQLPESSWAGDNARGGEVPRRGGDGGGLQPSQQSQRQGGAHQWLAVALNVYKDQSLRPYPKSTASCNPETALYPPSGT